MREKNAAAIMRMRKRAAPHPALKFLAAVEVKDA
jgi:hypothetical protein